MRRGLAIAMLCASATTAQDVPPAQVARLDEVGMAGRGDGDGVFVVHRTLGSGSFAELTALDTGRTILAEVRPGSVSTPDRIVDVSRGAATALALSDAVLAPIRIRPIVPSPQDQTALRGGMVVARLDAPPALLVALRRRLPATPRPSREMARHAVAPPTVVSPAPRPVVTQRPALPRPASPRPVAPAAGRWFVQVAALSDPTRAAALAKSVGGVVRRAGTLYRVQAGPFATRAAADAARAAMARRGFGDARTIAQD